MNVPDTSELTPLLRLSGQEGSAEGRQAIEMVLEVLPFEGAPKPDGTSFDINILLDHQGSVVLATSRKVPNLRFRLGEFLLLLTEQVVKLPTTISNPITAALSAISFLRSITGMATIPIEQTDAELLITIFRLTRDHEVISVDELIPSIKGLVEQTLIESLERLSHLGCIDLNAGQLRMNEFIVVKRR